jgi:hypothetical protein
MKEKMDLVWVKKEVYRLDPVITEEDDGFKVAVILISSVIVGANIKRLAIFTHYTREYIAKVGKYFRKNQVWKNGEVDTSEWFKKETGGVAFWMNVAVGQGFVKRYWKNKK